jgi:hypothetical protein
MNNLASKITSKIWYTINHTSEVNHSGNKLIKLIEESVSPQDFIEFQTLIKDKDLSKATTLINFIENILIENKDFQNKAKNIVKTNDASFQFEEKLINNSNINSEKTINLLLVGVSIILLACYFFTDDSSVQLFLKFDVLLLFISRLSRKFAWINGAITLLTLPFLLYQMMIFVTKDKTELVIGLAFIFLFLLFILIHDVRKSNKE